MSVWATAAPAASSAVAAPTQAITSLAQPACSMIGLNRQSRNTPEVTIVAAWMRADTGVGPAMASGSHTNSGSCADFAVAPRKNRSPTAVAVMPTIAPADRPIST